MKETIKYWFPVKVKNNSEYLAFKYILDKGFKAYMPMLRYSMLVDEREVWKVKPIFKGKLFVFCTFDDVKEFKREGFDIKFFKKASNPGFIEEKNFNFLKKMLSINELVSVVGKLKNCELYMDIELPEFGEISLLSAVYKEKEVVTWKVPVINSYVVVASNSAFIKYLILEYQESMVV